MLILITENGRWEDLDKLSRDGHRARMRQSFKKNEMDNLPDHNLLELFISGVIKRRDVKQIAYDLINEFGTLENVFKASVDDLMRVNGVGEVLAVELSLVNTFHKRIESNKNENVKTIKTVSEAIEFCKNRLSSENVEKVLMVTLDDKGKLLGNYIIGQGTVNESFISKRDAVSIALKDNATNVILSHNHPCSNSSPSAADINMTINFRKLFRDVGINLLDHIVIGENEASLILNSKIFK